MDFENLDPEGIGAIYQAIMASRIDFRNRIWETIRASNLLATGCLAATGGIIAGTEIPRQYLIFLGLTLIIIGAVLAQWTRQNVRREQSLQYHDEFPLYQIEKLLGLHNEIPEHLRWKADAPFMFGQKHISSKYKYKQVSTGNPDPVDEWVQGRLSQQFFITDIIFNYSGIMFIVMMAFGLFLILVGIDAII